MKRLPILILGPILGAMLSGALVQGTALAQELQRGETVLERRRPELEPLGIRAGAFLVLPRIEVGPTWESNIFATEDDPEGDWVILTRPSLDVRSDWNRHALFFSGSAEIGRYVEYTTENYADYRMTAGGRYDVTPDAAVDASGTHRRYHEGRSDPDSVFGAAEPGVFFVTGAAAGYRQQFNRLNLRLTGRADYFDYLDVPLRNGGESEQDYRDRWEYDTSLRLGYEFIDGYQAFVRGTYTLVRYANNPVPGRDSNGYEIVAGAAADFTGLITGEVFIGWLARDYHSSQLKDFSGLGFGSKVFWSPTELTTVEFAATRSIRETFVRGAGGQQASSYDRTVLAVGVDHELLRSLMLNARLQWRQDDFDGIERTDNVYTAGIGAIHQFNRYLYLSTGYTYETRDSTVPNSNYDDHIVFLRVGVQM